MQEVVAGENQLGALVAECVDPSAPSAEEATEGAGGATPEACSRATSDGDHLGAPEHGGARIARVEEGAEGRSEGLGALAVGEVAAVEAGHGHAIEPGRRVRCVRRGHDAIALAPEERGRRESVDLVGAIEEVAPLAAVIDDVADGARERSGGAGPRVHPGEELDVVAAVGRGGGAHPEPGAEAHERLADALDDGAVPRGRAGGRG